MRVMLWTISVIAMMTAGLFLALVIVQFDNPCSGAFAAITLVAAAEALIALSAARN